MRFGLERMRRLLTVLGSPQERFRGRARRRHQRQVLDGALHRGAARGPRRAHRRLPLAAPDVLRRAHPRRRRRHLRARLRGRDPARRGGRGEGRPDLSGRRPRNPVRAADRRRVLRARAPRGRGRRRRGGPGRPLGRDQRARRARSSCSPTSGWSTRAGSARRSPTSRGEARGRARRRHARCSATTIRRGRRARRAHGRQDRPPAPRPRPSPPPRRSQPPCPATSAATSPPRTRGRRGACSAGRWTRARPAVAAVAASPGACRSSTTIR